MPYKDLERKKEWERLHRPQRLARRRELRKTRAEERQARPAVPTDEQSGAAFLVPLIAGSTLAAVNPELGMAAAGITLVVAAIGKKGWQWWIVGCVTLVIALLGYFADKEGTKSELAETK